MKNINEILNKKRIDYAETVYNIAFTFAVLKTIFAFSELISYRYTDFLNNLFNVLFLVIMAYKLFFLQKYSIKQVFVLSIVGAAFIYTDFRIYRFLFIPNFLLLAATQDINFKKCMKYVWKIEAVILAAHVVVYPIRYYFGYVNYTVRGFNEDNRVRHQFLLQHANVFSMLLLWTIFAYIYANFEKMDKKRIVICWSVYAFFYIFTDSNSGMLILSIVSVLLILRDLFKDTMEKIITLLSRYLFIALSIIFTTMMVTLPNLKGNLRKLWEDVDSFFTGRLKYGAYAYAKHGFAFLGKPIDTQIKDYWQGYWIEGIPLDQSYMFLAVHYGLFFMILIGFFFWRYSKYASMGEKVIIIAYSLYTMMESYITYFHLCFALILVVKYIWKDHSFRLKKRDAELCQIE